MIDDPETPDVGVELIGNDRARQRVWASKAKRVDLVLKGDTGEQTIPMTGNRFGYFEVETSLPENGQRYGYSLDGGAWLPDPCSRWQPEGVDAWSAVYLPERFEWRDRGWKGIARENLVFYELHVGTFTTEGTFEAIIPRLDALKELGVNAIELMPVGQFPGERSWGYDVVHPFAPQHSYGPPESLQTLVQACHLKGLAIYLDVVYNHLGPESNHFPTFGDYFTERTKTAWGAAINLDDRHCGPVRAMILQNVRMWIRDYHFDGLRFDAADQIFDRSPKHLLAEAVEVAHREGDRQGRCVCLFAETDMNDAPRFLNPAEQGGYGFDGHWNDDFHHAAHVVLTKESPGYYQDFRPGPEALQKSLQQIFVNNGNYSMFRGRRHGTDASRFHGDRFVGFVQNHDQIGNGDGSTRYAAKLVPAAVRLAAGLNLLAPRLPLLFMGEEYGETRPFPFFCDFKNPDLIKAVREGRQAEFSYFGWGDVADPFAIETKNSAQLQWDWSTSFQAGLRRLYQDLLRLRREVEALRRFEAPAVELWDRDGEPKVLSMQRGRPGKTVTILFNLDREPQPLPADLPMFRALLRSESVEYVGREASSTLSMDGLLGYEFVIFS